MTDLDYFNHIKCGIKMEYDRCVRYRSYDKHCEAEGLMSAYKIVENIEKKYRKAMTND